MKAKATDHCLAVPTIMATLTTPPISPGGVGVRRRGPKSLPTLPLSAFSPPNTGISDSFPLPQSPTTVHPERIVDASVRCSIPEWKEQTNGSSLGGGRVGAIVVKANESELDGFVFLAVFFNYQFPFIDVIGLNPKLLKLTSPYSLSRSRSTWRAGQSLRSLLPSFLSLSLHLSIAHQMRRSLPFGRL